MNAPTASTAALLQADDLVFGYADKIVGSGLVLRLHPGRVLALLGPNGSGKTTLLRTLLGLLPPKGGSLRLAGLPIAGHSDRQRARLLAYVPQQHADVGEMRLADLVMTGRSAHLGLLASPGPADLAQVDQALRALGLEHLAASPLAHLSGGERQLAFIARALAQQARGVLLDEPTASLDLANQVRVMRETRRLAQAGLAVAFSTHDPTQALRHADEALLLKDGQPMACGPVQTVLSEESLQTLYQTPIRALRDPDGGVCAFLPG